MFFVTTASPRQALVNAGEQLVAAVAKLGDCPMLVRRLWDVGVNHGERNGETVPERVHKR